jgi:hypothetical protein
MRVSRIVLALSLVALVGTSALAEQIDNPQFKMWNKFGEGSSVTTTTSFDAPNGTKMNSEATTKLVSKSDDAITLEVSATMEVMGQTHTLPPHNQTISPKVEKGDEAVQVGTSTEKVEAAGKTFDCKIFELKRTLPNGKTVTAKAWVNEDVPGGVVKMEAKNDQGNVTSIIKSYEAK